MTYAGSPAAGNRWGSDERAEDYHGAVKTASTTELGEMTMTETETTTGIQRKRPLGRTVTPASALTWRKTATGYAIYLRDKGKALATLEPDAKYAGMWRTHMP